MAIVKASEKNTPESRKALVEQFCSDIKAAKAHFKPDFDRMIEDMYVCRHGSRKRWARGSDRYIVNITQRYVRQKVAMLYAKNPQAVAKRRSRLDFVYWDGRLETLQNATEMVVMAQQTGAPPPKDALMILQDVQTGTMRQRMLERVGKTLETLFHYYTNEQLPSFKAQMKGCVRSAIQTAVGYVKLGFQRDTDLSPDARAKIADFQARLAHIERLMAEVKEGEKDEYSAEAEELRLSINGLMQQGQVVKREGLVFDWPTPTSIIPDPKTISLKGWIGADWIAEEQFFTPDEIKEFFGIDLGDGYNSYSTRGREYQANPRTDVKENRKDMACVWIKWHKPSGLKYLLCDGYDDFLEEPSIPDVELERFFPVYALSFNELVSPDTLFPLSDVRTMLPQQEEMNRARESLRQHRRASLPKYVTPSGALQDDEKEKLSSDQVSVVVELAGMVPGQKVTDFLQPVPVTGIDPNLYETSSIFNDMMWSLGFQEATLGGTSKSTATEASIAEQSRAGSNEADVDELNDFLTELARDAGQVLLMEVSEETAKRIVGPGAVWPQMAKADIAAELDLEIVAGSNGRPNKAQRQYALQQLAPVMLQIPGISPGWLAKTMVQAVDDSIDMTEAYTEGTPSILALNDMSQVATGNPETSPEQQGPKGKRNQQKPERPDNAQQIPMGANNAGGGADGRFR